MTLPLKLLLNLRIPEVELSAQLSAHIFLLDEDVSNLLEH
jgi:hypothetical protein